MEDLLRTWLGAEKVLWLGRGIAGDDTHGHVDDLARFVGPRTVVAAVETRRSDINYRPLRDNLARLRRMRDLAGRRLEVATLPMPRPLFFRGARLPASYANFYIANGLVLVPTFNDPHDREALATLAGLFPRREVIGIHAMDLEIVRRFVKFVARLEQGLAGNTTDSQTCAPQGLFRFDTGGV